MAFYDWKLSTTDVMLLLDLIILHITEDDDFWMFQAS